MRPPVEVTWLNVAKEISLRSTCLRRQVGCVLTDRRGHVLSTGYNGRAAGLPHCNHHDPFSDVGCPNACEGAHAKPGEQLDACEAIHAEQNALLQCHDVYKIESCYVTTSPCVTCVKLLMNTSCRRIVFSERYAHDEEAMRLWLKRGPDHTWEHCK